ncbi:hypothetical protein [Aureivirga sp. CE67]|uniref:hypothetical protein n=1 Tax=Aureivirga sp. CE67 TaxID=1788983 RepID=UPI0018CA71C5|nr:hypothetical protein [Aureivirga sp. CE67]
MRKLLVIIILILSNSLNFYCQNYNVNNLEFLQDEIPQGKFKYELFLSEWGGRMNNVSCDVIIEGNKIKVLKNSETNLTGALILTQGIILKHKSGVWIIGESKSDENAEEIGGCTGGPIPIDFIKKEIEWC